MNITDVLPAWLAAEAHSQVAIATPADRMRYVVELSRRNVTEGTGGPFGAAVFECESGRLIAAGVNRVEALNLSGAHAEVVALSLAQRLTGQYDLSAPGLPRHALVSSAQPCQMCAGAVVWSGVVELTYAATKRDVERLLGFDEGLLPRGWIRQMRRRGIDVVPAVLRQEARSVLRLYRERGGVIYGAQRTRAEKVA